MPCVGCSLVPVAVVLVAASGTAASPRLESSPLLPFFPGYPSTATATATASVSVPGNPGMYLIPYRSEKITSLTLAEYGLANLCGRRTAMGYVVLSRGTEYQS